MSKRAILLLTLFLKCQVLKQRPSGLEAKFLKQYTNIKSLTCQSIIWVLYFHPLHLRTQKYFNVYASGKGWGIKKPGRNFRSNIWFISSKSKIIQNFFRIFFIKLQQFWNTTRNEDEQKDVTWAGSPQHIVTTPQFQLQSLSFCSLHQYLFQYLPILCTPSERTDRCMFSGC